MLYKVSGEGEPYSYIPGITTSILSDLSQFQGLAFEDAIDDFGNPGVIVTFNNLDMALMADGGLDNLANFVNDLEAKQAAEREAEAKKEAEKEAAEREAEARKAAEEKSSSSKRDRKKTR